jgi:hypothetical protein
LGARGHCRECEHDDLCRQTKHGHSVSNLRQQLLTRSTTVMSLITLNLSYVKTSICNSEIVGASG